MDSLAIVLAESIIGMGITITLLGILALLFHIIGKFGQKKEVVKTSAEAKKEEAAGSALPFIATAVYLYRTAERSKAQETIVKRVEAVTKSNREEWKKCGRRECMR